MIPSFLMQWIGNLVFMKMNEGQVKVNKSGNQKESCHDFPGDKSDKYLLLSTGPAFFLKPPTAS